MRNIESIDDSHQICKQLALKSISDLMAEYFDQNLDRLTQTGEISLPLASYFDYFMLPLFNEVETFNLNIFIAKNFPQKELQVCLKTALNDIIIFEDAVEMLILVKKIHEEQNNDPSDFDLKVLICTFYFRQMKQLKLLHAHINSLNLAQYRAKMHTNLAEKSSNTIAKTSVLENYKLRFNSKLQLLNAIYMFQK
ncbi:MAG: hypothetical protein ACKVOU_02975 [Cytophagales bacterium]